MNVNWPWTFQRSDAIGHGSPLALAGVLPFEKSSFRSSPSRSVWMSKADW